MEPHSKLIKEKLQTIPTHLSNFFRCRHLLGHSFQVLNNGIDCLHNTCADPASFQFHISISIPILLHMTNIYNAR